MKGRFFAQEFESNEIPSTWSKIASFIDQKDHTMAKVRTIQLNNFCEKSN